jgi:DUF917 family protein
VRRLTADEVRDILVGGGILGCGGGGLLTEGLKALDRAVKQGFDFELAELDELPPETMTACPYGVGGMTADHDDPRYARLPQVKEHPAVVATKVLQGHLDTTFGAILSGELGGETLMDAFSVAGALGVPVLDADTAGRAVPEAQHSMLYVHGVPLLPQAFATEFGDTGVFTSVVDDFRDDALLRGLATVSRNCVWVADHAVPVRRLKGAVVPGSISQALAVGRAYSEALEEGDVAAAVAEAGNGFVLMRGAVEQASWEDTGGFTFGEFTVVGDSPFGGSRLRIWYKNENHISWLDDEPFVTTPDLLLALNEDAGEPLMNPNATAGMRVAVVGLPAPLMWREERALRLFCPRSFGFDLNYRPMEEALERKPA